MEPVEASAIGIREDYGAEGASGNDSGPLPKASNDPTEDDDRRHCCLLPQQQACLELSAVEETRQYG